MYQLVLKYVPGVFSSFSGLHLLRADPVKTNQAHEFSGDVVKTVSFF